MKKLSILVLGLLILVGSSFAQNGKRNSAKAAMEAGKLPKAKSSIDAAILHPKTMNDAETWLVRSKVYIKISESQVGGLLMIDEEALPKAEESIVRARELDVENDFTEDIKLTTRLLAEKLYNKGAEFYNKKIFGDAAYNFEKSEILNASYDIIDTASMYSGGLSYHFAGNEEKMEEKFLKLLDLQFDNATVYILLGEKLAESDTEKAIEIVNKGRELYPENFSLVITAANIFLTNDRTEQALEALETAIEMDKTNFSLFHNVGIMYDLIFTNEENTEEFRFSAFDKAVEAYKQALELNAEFFDSFYNLGAINFNKGVYFLTKADALPLGDENYDVFKENAKTCMIDALPFLEKATSMQPGDINTLYSLKQIYSRTGNMDKYKEVDEKLKALEQ